MIYNTPIVVCADRMILSLNYYCMQGQTLAQVEQEVLPLNPEKILHHSRLGGLREMLIAMQGRRLVGHYPDTRQANY